MWRKTLNAPEKNQSSPRRLCSMYNQKAIQASFHTITGSSLAIEVTYLSPDKAFLF